VACGNFDASSLFGGRRAQMGVAEAIREAEALLPGMPVDEGKDAASAGWLAAAFDPWSFADSSPTLRAEFR